MLLCLLNVDTDGVFSIKSVTIHCESNNRVVVYLMYCVSRDGLTYLCSLCFLLQVANM